MGFYFGKRSKGRLSGVHSDLNLVFGEVIKRSPIDFGIAEGLRSIERQRELFKENATQTMDSKHLYGDAVDVAALRDGKYSDKIEDYILIAEVVKDVADEFGINIRWGGAWVILSQVTSAKEAYKEYINRKLSAGEKPFVDGMHFERI